MIYKKKYLPEVTILEMVADKEEGGETVKGYVSYLNEFGAKCVMSYNDFMDMYEENRYV